MLSLFFFLMGAWALGGFSMAIPRLINFEIVIGS